jgi:hypothetical protein
VLNGTTQPPYDTDGPRTEADFLLKDGGAYVKIEQLPKALQQGALREKRNENPRPWPIVITKHIKIGAQGTVFAVQNNVDADHSTQYVVLLSDDLDPSQALIVFNVDSNPNKASVSLTKKNSWARYRNGMLEDASTDPWPKELKDFVDQIQPKAAGLCH